MTLVRNIYRWHGIRFGDNELFAREKGWEKWRVDIRCGFDVDIELRKEHFMIQWVTHCTDSKISIKRGNGFMYGRIWICSGVTKSVLTHLCLRLNAGFITIVLIKESVRDFSFFFWSWSSPRFSNFSWFRSWTTFFKWCWCLGHSNLSSTSKTCCQHMLCPTSTWM